jgi:ABC-2 type transport system ATP-binding protein
VFGFLGPNGAGESTVINTLLDFVKPTAGSATVLDHDPTREAEAIRRRTGVLPEGGSLYERLTGSELVKWMARANDADGDADEQLGRVGLSAETADRAVGGYSKGMRQRLAFAMALVGDPELLILDRPSSGLDPTKFASSVNSSATWRPTAPPSSSPVTSSARSRRCVTGSAS